MIPLAHASRTQAPASTLNPNQALAFDLLLPFLQGASEAHMAVLEGYAGSGKTFLVAHLLAALEDFKIAVAAPTHKAVRVLRDQLIEMGIARVENGDGDDRRRPAAVGCSCRSIHAFLGLKLFERDDGRQEAIADRKATLCDYDVVIVDECSMIDAVLFEKIIIERGAARVLFVGDPAQLPPVVEKNRKAIRLSPVFDRVALKVRLTEVVRQARDNPMIRLSMRLRQLIEVGTRATPMMLVEALPPLTDGSTAALVVGTFQTLVDWYLMQRVDDLEGDTRIIVYTNARVRQYNQAIHRALHGESVTRFVAGERVMVHAQCAAERWIMDDLWTLARLVTSEELTVLDARKQIHPFYPDIPAERLELRGLEGGRYRVWIAADEQDLDRRVLAYFAEWQALKTRAEQARQPDERDRLKSEAAEQSAQGWALKNAFAPLRHGYAITAHKSQGSTFDCALVDFSDVSRMADPMEFNRALYVAVTRSRQFLAVVVT